MPVERYQDLGRSEAFPTYGVESVKEIDNKYWLQVALGGQSFLLPLIRIPNPSGDVAIGWCYMDPMQNPELAAAASNAMEALLTRIQPRVVVMPDSSKSQPFIREAVARLPQKPRLILLPGGTDEEVIRDRTASEITAYKPVTGRDKFMGYPAPWEPDSMPWQELQQLCPNGENLTIVDDVYTTGATVRTMQSVLQFTADSRHQIAVVAYERLYNGANNAYQDVRPPNLSATFGLTEFTGLDEIGFTTDKFHSFDRATIPAAVALVNSR